MSPTNWQHRAEAGIGWLLRSIAATGHKGSAHHYMPLLGWAPAYPETTGYIVETLLDYADLWQNDSLRTTALRQAEWLAEVQLPQGAFPGGTVHVAPKPSTFNTAMVLFGLAKAYPLNPPLFAKMGVPAANWLLNTLEEDGSWQHGAYIPGYVPAYYTFALWGLLRWQKEIRAITHQSQLKKSLHFYAQKMRSDGTVSDWDFKPGAMAFTHTIAYTLQGLLESALLLEEQQIVEKVAESALLLWRERQKTGRTAGRYGKAWKADRSFTCPTGNAQLATLYHRLWGLTQEKTFNTAALALLEEAAQSQYLGLSPHRYGALPGSKPFWGPYMRFRYPNWGVKFLVDAIRTIHL